MRLPSPGRMLSRVHAPPQTLEVEVPLVSEEVPQLREEAVRYVPQPKDRDMLAPALRAAGAHSVFGTGLCWFAHVLFY
jgi:hypothetical protein